MAGTAPLDARGTLLDPPILSSSFETTPVLKSGYRFVLHLASDVGPSGEVGPAPPGEAGRSIDLREKRWCAYAWPEEPGPERPALFVDETGEILECHVRRGPTYCGARGPEPDAVITQVPRVDDPETPLDESHLRADGNLWLPVR